MAIFVALLVGALGLALVAFIVTGDPASLLLVAALAIFVWASVPYAGRVHMYRLPGRLREWWRR